MRLLFFDFGAYTFVDIADYFKRAGINYDVARYSFADKNKDDFFEYRFGKMIKESQYDAVFSINYFPLVAKCCHDNNLKYISWSYDNPLNVLNIEETLWYETNYVFLFDRIQAEKYMRQGYKTVYHLPLAVDANRLSRINITGNDIEKYKCPISFVGKLYDSDIGIFMSYMNDYQKGFVDGAIKAQGQLYGCYILDTILTDRFIDEINETYKSKNTNLLINKEALSYAMAAETTRQERLLLLRLLSNHFKVNLYSRENHPFLSKADYKGSCRYLDEMPKIFRLSDINLNINLKISQSGVPLRVMDILGSGGFLLSSWQPEVAEYFEDGYEAALYESVEDAYDKADYYLKHDDIRKQIARNGFDKVSTLFSYEKQFETLFDVVGIDI